MLLVSSGVVLVFSESSITVVTMAGMEVGRLLLILLQETGLLEILSSVSLLTRQSS